MEKHYTERRQAWISIKEMLQKIGETSKKFPLEKARRLGDWLSQVLKVPTTVSQDPLLNDTQARRCHKQGQKLGFCGSPQTMFDLRGSGFRHR